MENSISRCSIHFHIKVFRNKPISSLNANILTNSKWQIGSFSPPALYCITISVMCLHSIEKESFWKVVQYLDIKLLYLIYTAHFIRVWDTVHETITMLFAEMKSKKQSLNFRFLSQIAHHFCDFPQVLSFLYPVIYTVVLYYLPLALAVGNLLLMGGASLRRHSSLRALGTAPWPGLLGPVLRIRVHDRLTPRMTLGVRHHDRSDRTLIF